VAEGQLELFDARRWTRERRIHEAGRLADAIAARLHEPVRLVIHDNRSTMVSWRRDRGLLHYRVHHMFLDAPAEVVEALAAFGSPGPAARRRAAGRGIDAYVKRHRGRIGEGRPVRLDPRGRHHDLRALFDEENRARFGGAVQARIGWGKGRNGGRQRSIKTGVYLHDQRVIRIHPALDRPEVPAYYVRAVVFHEMLHQVVPVLERRGRRVVHSADFRRRERAHPDYARARAWEANHLHLLLDRSRGRAPR
jgi:predicted metal-dependent hydrolase